MPTYSPEWDPGDYRANNENRQRMGFGGTEFGGQQYAQRSRMLGDEAQRRGAYVSDMTQSNESRGQQYDALDALHGAALGTAPSQAAILAQNQGQAAIAANTAMAGSVKGGPGARVAAMRAAMAGNAAQQQQIAGQAAAARANEMATARGQYAGAATAARASDLDAARIQQANELTQRQLNDAQQRFFENQGFNIQTQDQNNQLQQQQLASNNWVAGRQATMADEGFGFGKDMTYVSAGAAATQGGIGAAMGAAGNGGKPNPDEMGSDERMKQLVPMSGAAPASFDKLSPGGGMNILGSLKAHSDFATRFQGDPSGGMMLSPREAKIPASLDEGMQRSFDGRDEGVTYGYFSDPYAREVARGVAGAPKGYAAERAGQPGGMFGAEQSGGYVAEPLAADGKRMAPGTADFEATKPTPAESRRADILSGILGGLARGTSMRSDVRSKEGVMLSDERAKRAAFEEGVKYADADHAGQPIKPPSYAVGAETKAATPKEEPKPAPAKKEQVPTYGETARAIGSHPVVQAIGRAGAPLVLGPMGAGALGGYEMGEQYARSDERAKAKPGDVPESSMYAAMRSMKPSLYAYKPEFRPPEQAPGEVQAGPMANDMARDPVASTAIVKDPQTGLLAIDKDKALKLTMGSLAVLADDVQGLKKKGGKK